MKYTQHFIVENFSTFKQQLLQFANSFNSCCYLDNNDYQNNWKQQELLVAFDACEIFLLQEREQLTAFQNFLHVNKNSWVFGNLNYDLKNTIDDYLTSAKQDFIGFDNLSFFIPEYVVIGSSSSIAIYSNKLAPEIVFENICNQKLAKNVVENKVNIQPRIAKEAYINIINKLRQHIQRGDCYEINFCQEFYSEDSQINPLQVFTNLNNFSPNPFSCFYKAKNKYLLCGSPERYIKRTGNLIYSQPIKGTAARSLVNDEAQKTTLLNSKKEQSENVMVVDLVRNDLSKICKKGTVKVEELFGIYTYPQVHQMVSTISGQLIDNVCFTDILKATFPMGSMTGAPKRKVMELIETYEQTKRGIFSGAVGYIAPDGNFDFNVVIRSIMYNADTKYVNFLVGSGITWYSNAEDEYEECMLKAEAMRKVLEVS